jgi:hypothetical protein
VANLLSELLSKVEVAAEWMYVADAHVTLRTQVVTSAVASVDRKCMQHACLVFVSYDAA